MLYQDAFEAYQAEHYVEAERIWLALARRGNIQSQFKLATLYDEGLVESSNAQADAFYWYEQAAMQGHAIAAYNLGNAYKHGRGEVQSESLANYWWQKASDAGLASAQFNLALQYSRGLGVVQDQEQAVLLINEAARNGHARARNLLDTGQIPTRENLYPRQLAQTVDDQSSPAMSAPASEQQVEDKDTGPVSAEVDDLSWLASQSPERYTIQLAVMASRENVRAFLQRHNLSGRTHVLPLNVKGQKLNYIVLESFDTKSACEDAIAGLSTDLKKVGPWPRAISDLQNLSGKQGSGKPGYG